MEVTKVNLINTRVVDAAVKGNFDATDVASSATSPESIKTKSKKKAMMQVKIKRKKGKYMSKIRTITATTTCVFSFLKFMLIKKRARKTIEPG